MIPLLPLLFCLLTPAHADSPRFEILSGIDDQVTLKEGETALIVSVSKPIYLSIQMKHRHRYGVRLRQASRERYLFGDTSSHRDHHREVSELDWKNPFPIAGPCTIRLGTSAVTTMRIVGEAGS